MKLTLPLPPKFRLRSVVLSHGWYQTLPFRWDDEAQTLHRVDRMRPRGRAHRVVLRQRGRELEVDIVGLRARPTEYLARVERALQLGRNLGDFYRVVANDRHLAWIEKKGHGRILSSGDLFEDVTKAICGTNITWVQAVRMANRICELGPRVPGSEARAFPSPAEVLEAGESWLVREARTGYRARSIIELAQNIVNGRLDESVFLAHGVASDGAELRRQLQSIRGIGPSTSRYLAAFFGQFDAVSVDSAVIAYAARAHFSGRIPTPRQVERHFARYGPWCGLVSWLEVWRDYCIREGVTL